MTAVDRAPLVRTTADGVAWLTLDRPEKRNALDDALVEALKAELRAADDDHDVRAIAIRGAGTDFCSGADLSALRRIAGAGVMENLADADSLAELFQLPRRLRKPVVAVVHGHALAGGCGLATACDLVIAARSARFGYPEVKIGFVPAMVMAILRRNLPEKRAFELVAVGESIGAEDAERIGLINRAIDDDDFEEAAAEYLRALAARSASAVQLSKRLLYLQDGMSLDSAIRAGADVNALARATDDTRIGIERFLSREG